MLLCVLHCSCPLPYQKIFSKKKNEILKLHLFLYYLSNQPQFHNFTLITSTGGLYLREDIPGVFHVISCNVTTLHYLQVIRASESFLFLKKKLSFMFCQDDMEKQTNFSRRKKFVFCVFQCIIRNINFKKAEQKKTLFPIKKGFSFMGYIESVPREKVITYIAAVNLRSFHKEVLSQS